MATKDPLVKSFWSPGVGWCAYRLSPQGKILQNTVGHVTEQAARDACGAQDQKD